MARYSGRRSIQFRLASPSLSDGSRSVADIARSLSEGVLLDAGQIDHLVTAGLGRLFQSGDITLEPASDQ
jgi:hypothetical protein